jgi:hypothetical protein
MENLDLTHLPRGQKNTESPVSIFRVKLDQNAMHFASAEVKFCYRKIWG